MRNEHSHSHAHSHEGDEVLQSSAEAIRTLWISLAGLGATALGQTVVVVLSGSVALLGDALHNSADALTAVPLGLAFMLSRRRPNRRYTYGYGRAEDMAGLVIVAVIVLSSAVAAVAAVTRLLHPHPVTHLIAVAVAAALGFAGNELVARYRIRTGRRIGSATLVADGLHARTDGYTSLTEQAETTLRATPGVLDVGQLRLRWVGHTLRAECQISVDPNCSVVQAHDVAVGAEHGLIHAMPRLAAATVHADPAGGADHHALLADHLGRLHPGQDAGQQGAHPAGGGVARLDDLGVAEAMPGQARRQVRDQRDAEHVGPHLAGGDRL
jgi:divalent metal cation (Fe/Co/Zn/Cd) transporter